MLDIIPDATNTFDTVAAKKLDESSTRMAEAAFTKDEEERKREEYLLRNPSLRMRIVSAAITFAERTMPPHLRRNQPREPHQAFK